MSISPPTKARRKSCLPGAKTVLGLSEAARILKLAQIGFLALASKKGFSPPSPELVAMHSAELEAYERPIARHSERKRVQQDLENMSLKLDEDVWRLKHIIEWSGAPELQRSRLLSEQAVTIIGVASSAIASAISLLVEGGAADEISEPSEGNTRHEVDEK
ncbi:hypothetical protein [Neorhizobium tomejilense]|uniref:hypothetical protein n=1 Tax=Neorhizobium tomejilense TaxID=2093828 RepID=UPI00155E0729|nr:hypothetical protein [Neorhizobium tomejilense]